MCARVRAVRVFLCVTHAHTHTHTHKQIYTREHTRTSIRVVKILYKNVDINFCLFLANNHEVVYPRRNYKDLINMTFDDFF